MYDPHCAAESAAPAAAPIVVSCSLTREDLDQYLAQSGYGANVAMFSCYFARDVRTGAPLCMSCGRPIGEHVTAAAQPLASAAPVMATEVVTATPMGLTVGATEDILEVPPNHITLIGFGLACAFLMIQVVIFASVGLYSSPVWIGPVILVGILVYFSFRSQVTRIVFFKGQGPHSAVHVTRRYLLGCQDHTVTTVAGLGQVGFREVRTKSSIFFIVFASNTAGEETQPHYTQTYDQCMTEYNAWKTYFALYGMAPHPEWIPTIVTVSASRGGL